MLLIASLFLQTLGPIAYARPLEGNLEGNAAEIPLPVEAALHQEPDPAPPERPPGGEEPQPPEEPIPDDPLVLNPPEIEETLGVPVQVRLSTDKAFLLAGESAQLTIDIWRSSKDDVAGLPVVVSLPPELKTTGRNSQTEWKLPELTLEGRFSQVVDVKIANASIEAGVVDVLLTVEPSDGRPSITKALQIGVVPNLNKLPGAKREKTNQGPKGAVLGAEDGRVVLMSPAGAMPEGAEISFERITRADLPEEGPTPEEEVPNFHHWDFTAAQDGQLLETFEKPLLLVYQVEWLEERDVEPSHLGLLTRKSAEDPWVSVPTSYLSKRKILLAKLNHFSEYKIGLELDVKGDILPSISSFSSDLFTGAATVSYPIEVPAGAGGMAPALSLSYSSGSVDDFYETNGASPTDWDVQASNVGLGWNLGGISYIGLTDSHAAGQWDDRYSLVLNGTSTEIRFNQMVPEHFIKVSRNLPGFSDNPGTKGVVKDAGTWSVTSQNGTQHTFGTNVDPRPMTATDSPQNVIMHLDDNNTYWQANKWYLTESKDTSGNYITYEYHSDPREIRPNGVGSDCSSGAYASVYQDKNYYRAIRPDKISWGGNKNAASQSDKDPKMQVVFNYADRTDIRSDGSYSDNTIATDKDWALARCTQYTYSTKKLIGISVQVKVDGNWKDIREYELNQSYTSPPSGTPTYTKHLRLNNIKHYGYSSSGSRTASPLNIYTFGYEQLGHHAQFYLTSADNGWGGKSIYTYTGYNTTEYEISDSNVAYVSSTDVEDYRRRVGYTKIEDGLGNYFYTIYGYGNARQRLYRGGVDFLGHDYVSNRVYKMNTGIAPANEVRYRQHWFHQLGSGGGGNPDPRVGREYVNQSWQPASTLGGSCGTRPALFTNVLYCRMNRVENTWAALSGSGASWSDIQGNYHARPRWVRQDKVITRIEDQYATGGYATTEQRFHYQTWRQNNQQFGQITAVEDFAEGVRQRTSYTSNSRM